jgi:hypothetical protein
VGQRRFVGVVAVLGTILVLGLLPGSAAAGTGWNGFTWTEVGNQNTVTFTITDSSPSQSWKSFFFQADGTPANSIQATDITVTVGSTTDTKDCAEQSGTNALQIGCQGFATGFLGVGKTVTLSWLAGPQILANVGGYFGGTDFASQSNAGDVTGPTIQSGVCDWTVAFVDPPSHARSFPIDYHVLVGNAGNAPCVPASLFTKSMVKIPGLGTDPSSVEIPGLQPGASYTADFAAIDANPVSLDDFLWQHFKSASLSVGFQADMPLDDDLAPPDEIAGTSIKLLPEVVSFVQHHANTFDTDCPSEVPFTNCHLEVFVVIFREHQRGTSHVGQLAAARQPLLVGTAHGVIKPGKGRPIHYTLNKSGRKLQRKLHKLSITLIGSRKQGAVTTLIKGHLTLH